MVTTTSGRTTTVPVRRLVPVQAALFVTSPEMKFVAANACAAMNAKAGNAVRSCLGTSTTKVWQDGGAVASRPEMQTGDGRTLTQSQTQDSGLHQFPLQEAGSGGEGSSDPALNLLSPRAFYWSRMVAMTESERLPVAAARSGVSEAWDTLFRRYQLPLYAYVFELVRDEQASLDIVQESFINAARHIDRLRDDAKFGSWLFGIAHQKCIQRWRRRDRELLAVGEVVEEYEEPGPDPGDWLLRKEEEEGFMNCLQRLSPPHRAVLLLHFLEEFPLEEIASVTGATLGTVKSRLHYAKKALRRLLEETL